MLRDTVNLNVNEGDHYEVMTAITDAIANPTRGHSNGFVVIADNVTTTTNASSIQGNDVTVASSYISRDITSVSVVTS